MIKISASILAADFARLGEEVKTLEREKIPYIHIDVMDGHFVPNISMGIPIVESIRKTSNAIFDVHLMLTNPEDYIERFAKAGADIINFHFETVEEPFKTIEKIRKTGKKCAITINPETPVEKILEIGIVDYVDMVLIMSVYPGFGGQEFLPSSFDRIKKVYQYIKKNNLDVDIEVDGGVRQENVRDIIAAGANVIVMGSALFKAKDISYEVQQFNKIFREFENR